MIFNFIKTKFVGLKLDSAEGQKKLEQRLQCSFLALDKLYTRELEILVKLKQSLDGLKQIQNTPSFLNQKIRGFTLESSRDEEIMNAAINAENLLVQAQEYPQGSLSFLVATKHNSLNKTKSKYSVSLALQEYLLGSDFENKQSLKELLDYLKSIEKRANNYNSTMNGVKELVQKQYLLLAHILNNQGAINPSYESLNEEQKLVIQTNFLIAENVFDIVSLNFFEDKKIKPVALNESEITKFQQHARELLFKII